MLQHSDVLLLNCGGVKMLGLKKKRKDKISGKSDSAASSAVEASVVDTGTRANVHLADMSGGMEGRLENDMLTYSVQDDYSFLEQIRASVLEGMSPMVVQDSRLAMFDVKEGIRQLMSEKEGMPRDYVPGTVARHTDVGEVEVHIL